MDLIDFHPTPPHSTPLYPTPPHSTPPPPPQEEIRSCLAVEFFMHRTGLNVQGLVEHTRNV